MFEVNRKYVVTWLEETGDGPVETKSTFTVVEWSAPLLKAMQPYGETIFNISSPHFVRAEKVLQDEEKPPPPEIWITPVAGDGTKGAPFKIGSSGERDPE